ncbi:MULTISPECIES: enoyl-CoA hydratase-related protein [Thalassospira]|mgnify:CR=1 FL=1|uniref:enoyl-CoA hydratase-related protein n=1 Tax=Thalassospira TaxID=168934 RepID=UPI000C0B8164|nr:MULTISPECIES: enoyl-CoA hydratase-related protein [Thalassospira]MAC33266.1 enoyl-CoA hydratase [Haliea sp.]HBS21691.1 enoyl-CoA hydratase [Thalassospira sp.]|tara:strand:- start:1794 stop:2525 length:732 start_codon:yes stop_codon:yes gene_type:complete
METRITSEISDNICTISINRPEKRNALNETMFDALANAMNRAHEDTNVHCVLLQGTGPHYSAGHDIAEFARLWPQSEEGAVRRCISAFAKQSKPMVAAVTGAAVGFGATMLLHADWVVAGDSAVFKFPFADLGIVPEAGATALLARRVGDIVARDWLLSGHRISADEALHHRFVSSVKPDADVHAAARDYALCLAAKPTEALQTSRRLLNEGLTLSASEAIEKEAAYLNSLIPAVAKASGKND